jgi:hypothetical protein
VISPFGLGARLAAGTATVGHKDGEASLRLHEVQKPRKEGQGLAIEKMGDPYF